MDQLRRLRDNKGREVVHFVTPSGVHAWIDTSIPDAALQKFARSLRRKLKAQGSAPNPVPCPVPTGKQRRQVAGADQQSRQETK